MSKTLPLTLSMLALTGIITAGTGKLPSRRVTPNSSAESHKPAKSGPLAYTVALKDTFNQFGVLDIGTGTFHPIAGLPNPAQGIGRDAEGGIYIVDSNNNLVRINPGNGKTEVVGSTGVTTPGPVGPVLVDVFASLANGELFLMDYSNNLYSVNPRTGAATLIGPTGIPPIISPIYSSSLAGDCKNLFFTIDEVDENFNQILPPTLYRIDPGTGAATLVGPTAPVMPGAGFIDGALYGFSLNRRLFGGTEGPHVFSIDTSTGVAALISDLSVDAIGGAVRFAGVQAGRCKSE